MEFTAWLQTFTDGLSGLAIPAVLFFCGGYFGFKTGFFPFRHPFRVISAVWHQKRGDGISPGRALSLALAGTLGVGNLAGVSAALAVGGAGAVFWMWISATLAMVLKYAEIVLSLRHRRREETEMRGCAMYYMEDLLRDRANRKGASRKGHFFGFSARFFPLLFALFCLCDAFSMGCIVQVNAIAESLSFVAGASPALVGGAVGLTVLVLGFGGIGRVSRWTEALIPAVTVGFVCLSVGALFLRRAAIPAVFRRIVTEAFTLPAAGGGLLGSLLSPALSAGCMRGLLSNEAGCGTSPMAHASADTEDSFAQGCLGILEVFVDTHLLCTLTALVILSAGEGVFALCASPMRMTISAYVSILGDWAGACMTAAVLLFGFSTVLCWSQYARMTFSYLSGGRGKALCLLFYAAFCVFGAVLAPESTWLLADFSISCMTLLNLFALLLGRREVAESVRLQFIKYRVE